jgi:hypothetical protein
VQTHETYMCRCLELGRTALETGETPVGALAGDIGDRKLPVSLRDFGE